LNQQLEGIIIMKPTKLFLYGLISISLFFIGCDKSTEPEEKPEVEFEKSVSEMNLTALSMLNSKMYMGLLQMPAGLVALPDVIFPKIAPNSLAKKGINKNYSSADSSFLNLFARLEALYGTHTFDGTQWNHTDSPANEVIIQYPFVDVSNNSNHQMYVRLFGVIKSESLLQISMEAKVDNILKFYLDYAKINGINLLSTNPNPTIINVKGKLIDENNKNNLFDFTVNNEAVSIALTPSGMQTLTVTFSGSGFLSPPDSLSQIGQQVQSVTIVQGKIKIEITELDILDGDAGDIFYNGKKIADIMMVNNEPYIYYLNGKQVAMKDIMPLFGDFTNG